MARQNDVIRPFLRDVSKRRCGVAIRKIEVGSTGVEREHRPDVHYRLGAWRCVPKPYARIFGRSRPCESPSEFRFLLGYGKGDEQKGGDENPLDGTRYRRSSPYAHKRPQSPVNPVGQFLDSLSRPDKQERESHEEIASGQ